MYESRIRVFVLKHGKLVSKKLYVGVGGNAELDNPSGFEFHDKKDI